MIFKKLKRYCNASTCVHYTSCSRPATVFLHRLDVRDCNEMYVGSLRFPIRMDILPASKTSGGKVGFQHDCISLNLILANRRCGTTYSSYSQPSNNTKVTKIEQGGARLCVWEKVWKGKASHQPLWQIYISPEWEIMDRIFCIQRQYLTNLSCCYSSASLITWGSLSGFVGKIFLLLPER